MRTNEKKLYESLSKLYEEASNITINDNDKIVVFSDLHMGNGGKQDDFLPNSDFFKHILEQYYLKNNYKLILNGDIEELQKFPFKQITEKWRDLYQLFGRFEKEQAFFKIVGNHDHELLSKKLPPLNSKIPICRGLKLNYHDHHIVVFHGHQASLLMERFHFFCTIILKYIANPIGIKNYSVSHDSTVKYNTEKRVYNFARDHKIVSLIGHTHRPLFESLSKIEYLKFKIEQYCRDYSQADEYVQQKLAAKINKFNEELQYLSTKKNKRNGSRSSLYNSDLMVPCLFNSGCVIGKKGITAIEITNGSIALVHWFDRRKSQKYLDYNGYIPEQLGDSEYFRVVFKEDNLNYIFARIKLLA
jgi:UDP-2,3-diacylglucosamine pyrophosphatase LpxH